MRPQGAILLNARRRHRLDHEATQLSSRKVKDCSTPVGVIVSITVSAIAFAIASSAAQRP